jgi:hypothetical protein
LYFFFNLVVSSTALWEVWCSSSFAKGIKGVSASSASKLPMFQKADLLNGVWRPLDCRAYGRPQINFQGFGIGA